MSEADRYRVNKLMQELSAHPDNMADFAANRTALYDRYGLTPDQRAALDEGGRERLTAVGLHPVLQMHHFIVSQPDAAEFVSVKAYKHMVDRNG